MVKRKSDESAFEFRKRKKKLAYKKEHQYDAERSYWKEQNSKAYKVQKGLIGDLFAGVNAAKEVRSVVSSLEAAEAAGALEVIPGMFGGTAEAVALGESIAGGVVLGGVAGAAIGGAALGYLAGEVIGSLFTQNSQSTVVGRLMPGTYQGKIQLSAGNSFKGLRDKYQKKGACSILENYGTVADPDIVFIGQSSWNTECFAHSVGLAMLRKLFRVGIKVDVKTPYEELPLINTNPDSGPNGYVIVYETRNAAGTITTATYPILNNKNLSQLVLETGGGFNLFNNITNCLVNNDPPLLFKIFLYQQNNNNTESRLVHKLDLEKEIVSVAMTSHMVIQNRTKSSAGSTDTLQVDAQPLKGPVYEFSSGVPKMKEDSPWPLQTLNNSGLILIRNAQFNVEDQVAYKEPLVKKSFQNVTKNAYVRLSPGALKSMTIGSDIRGYYHKVLYKCRLISTDTIVQCYGKSQLAMFEEELNSGSANNITIQYEAQHIVGADFTTTYNPNMAPTFGSVAINNVPA